MIYLLYTIHVVVCLFLILVVLLQQGKGADLSVFGGGATQAAFGARGAVSLLHKLTVWGFVAFIVTTVSIGFMTASRKASSVMSDVPAAEAPAAAPEGVPEGEGQGAATGDESGEDEATVGVEGGDVETGGGETGDGEPLADEAGTDDGESASGETGGGDGDS